MQKCYNKKITLYVITFLNNFDYSEVGCVDNATPNGTLTLFLLYFVFLKHTHC